MTVAARGLRRLEDIHIDLDRQRVLRDGVALDVGGLSFRLLAYLLEQGDRVVGFDELIEAVWAPAVVGEETVTQRIKLLRQALGDDGRNPRYVRSVRGRGYQLCSPVTRLDAPTTADPAPTPSSAQATADHASRSGHGRRWLIGAPLVALLVAGALTAHWHFRGRTVAAPVAAPADGDAGAPALQRAHYYASIGQDDNNERAIALFNDALRDQPGNVDAQLGLSQALSARLCLYNRPAEGADQAEALARHVIAAEPGNALAYQALAYALDCRGLIDQALAAYQKAYALDPATRSSSLASAAHILAVKGHLAEALEANMKVSGQRARLRFLDIQIARSLELLGFAAAAEQRYQRSFRLYPDNVFSNVAWPRSLFLQGRLAEAGTALDEALRRPRHPELLLLAGELALLRGSRDAAAAAFEQARALRPHTSLPTTLSLLYGNAVPAATVLEARIAGLRTAIAAGDYWPETQLEIAMLANAAGQRSIALDAIDAAVDAGFSDRAYLQISPLLRPLAGEPRFASAIDTISQRVAAERAIVLAAEWRPADVAGAVTARP